MQVMRLLYLSITALIIIIPIRYGDNCTRWDGNANYILPHRTGNTLVGRIPEYINEITTDNDIFDRHNRDFIPDLHNEDIHWNISQLISKNGYPVEEHKVTTIDGYILGMFRIPGPGSVVFLMHELFGSSDNFVTPGKGHALAYELAAAGYDVWFGNARGNVHSRRNIHLSPDSKDFWDFSWDDIGRKDLPAMIDYVLQKTNQNSLQYIGYSQGTTAFFVLCSERPEYNEKISIMISLAAVAWISHATNPVLKFAAFFSHSPSLFEHLFGHELMPRNKVTNAITDMACSTPETAKVFCNTLLSFLTRFDYPQVNTTYLPRVYAHYPAGISAKQLLHYGQGFLSGRFRHYDYGVFENLKRYASIWPPDYPVQKITTRVVIIQSDNDNIATNEDVNILMKKLPNFNFKSDFYKIPYKLFTHSDFVVANDVKILVHDKILHILAHDLARHYSRY